MFDGHLKLLKMPSQNFKFFLSMYMAFKRNIINTIVKSNGESLSVSAKNELTKDYNHHKFDLQL